jgi:NitT/TauT family transport system ATP-binding protein
MDDVTMTYGGRNGVVALKNFTLRVGRGEFAAIVGPSGCGKSTFLKLASGLRPASAGGVIVGEREVAGPLKFVGMAFQNPVLLPWRTCLQNVMLPFEIVEPFKSRRRVDKEIHREKAYQLLKTVGLAEAANRYPWQLSGGMQQRASIARALAFDADLLLMDEPFGALDEIVRDHLNEELLKLWDRTNKTICFVTHSIPEAVYLSTKIVVMSPRPGRVTDIIESTLPAHRPLDIRETPEFLEIAHRVREGLRAGHSYEQHV